MSPEEENTVTSYFDPMKISPEKINCVMTKILDCGLGISIAFTYGLMPLGNVLTFPFSITSVLLSWLDQSAGAVYYTNYIPAEG